MAISIVLQQRLELAAKAREGILVSLTDITSRGLSLAVAHDTPHRLSNQFQWSLLWEQRGIITTRVDIILTFAVDAKSSRNDSITAISEYNMDREFRTDLDNFSGQENR